MSAESDVVWDDPPTKNYRWKERLSPLMAQPKRWARVHVCGKNYANSMAATIRDYARSRGAAPALALPAGRWEARAARIEAGPDAGKYGVWARYMGPVE